jgi:hypothetical protein
MEQSLLQIQMPSDGSLTGGLLALLGWMHPTTLNKVAVEWHLEWDERKTGMEIEICLGKTSS